MCDLCSESDASRLAERNRLRAIAERLERHARGLRQMATGDIKPHTDAVDPLVESGQRLIRELAEQWL